MAHTKDSLLYEEFQYSPLKHLEESVMKQLQSFVRGYAEGTLFDNQTFLGIEVEVERMDNNGLTLSATALLGPTWAVKTDGSLRNNGREFISLPVRGKNAVAAVKLLEDYLNTVQKGHEFSERTSVHIHVNVRKMSFEQAATFIVVYLAVEKSIFKFIKSGGWDRSNNIFCVALSESDFFIGLHNLLSYLNLDKAQVAKHDNHPFVGILQSMWRKYTAFNTLPVAEKGTFEFRHMGGTCDSKILIDWMNLILSLKKYAETHSLEDTLKTITDLNVNSQYIGFLQSVFGIYYDLVAGENIQAELEDGVCSVKDILLWSSDVKSFPDTIDEFKSSSMFKYLEAKFGLDLEDIDVTKLKTEYEELNKKYTDIGFILQHDVGTKLGYSTKKEWDVAYRDYLNIQRRMTDINRILNPRMPKTKTSVFVPPEVDENFFDPVPAEQVDDDGEDHPDHD